MNTERVEEEVFAVVIPFRNSVLRLPQTNRRITYEKCDVF